MWLNSTLKPLYKQIFAPKGFFFLRYRTLKFPGFCVTWHLAEGQESSYVGWKYYRSWEILPSKHSLSPNKYYFNLYEFLRRRIHALVGNSKTDVSVVFGGHICATTNMVSPYKALWFRVKRFSEYLAYEILYRPDSWQGFLYSYLLSFPRF